MGDRIHHEIKAANTLGIISAQILHGRYSALQPRAELEEPDYRVERIGQVLYIVDVLKHYSHRRSPRVVAVGGGTGLPIVLEGLKAFSRELTAIVDYNKIQQSGPVGDMIDLDPLADKWRAFGWAVREIDGHDMAAIVDALDELPFAADQPSLIIAHTVKGKGVSFAEDTYAWHSNFVTDGLYQQALDEWGEPA